MKLYSDCSGPCDDCYYGFTGGCLAGHGDDHFTQITERDAITIIKKGWIRYDDGVEELFKRFPNIERKLKIDKINGKIQVHIL